MNVSLLMGVYNAESTVRKAVDSIFAQSYQDFELIVCDDGSIDGSYAVLEECHRQYGTRLTLLQNEINRGLAPTLNRCFTAARGLYIGRMDADDRSAPERLARQMEFLQTHQDIGFVGCCALKFDENGVYDTFRYMKYPEKKDLLWGSCFIHPTVLIRRAVLESAHGYSERKFCVRCEDYDLWLRLYALGYRGANLQETLFYYYEGTRNMKKRKYRYRVNEAIVRAIGFYRNRMLLQGIPYIVKPLVIGLLPIKL